MIVKTFEIDAAYLSVVETKLEKLNKRGAKLSIAPAVIQESVKGVRKIYKEKVEYGIPYDIEVLIPTLTLTVWAEMIQVGNYTLMASLDHTLGELPVIRSAMAVDLPKNCYSNKSICQHCNVDRQRNFTYVFSDNAQAKTVQVGSTCLEAYFGINPTAKLDWFGAFGSFCNEEYSGGYAKPHFYTKDALATAMALVKRYGYVSRKMSDASEERTGHPLYTTANRVNDFYNPVYNGGGWNAADEIAKRLREEIRNEAAALQSDAGDLIAWGIEYFASQTTDYAHNMGIFLTQELTEPRNFGYLVSVIACKTNSENQTKVKVVSENKFLGAVGDKIEVEVEVKKVIPMDGNYGTTYITILQEKQSGNNLVWFSSGKVLDENSEIKIKGTVKAHTVRDGKNQTVLTRCKVL